MNDAVLDSDPLEIAADVPAAAPAAVPAAIKPEEAEPAPAEDRVPVRTLIEERRARQAAEARADTVARQVAELTAKIEALTKKPEVEPDPQEQPLEHLQHKLGKLEKTDAEILKTLEETRAANRAQQFHAQVAAMEAAFAKEHADYYEAHKFLVAARLKDCELMGLDSATTERLIADEAQWMIGKALAARRNPAEVVYGMAKARGFAAAPAAAPAAKSANPAAATLKEVAKNIREATTLANAPGKGAPPAEPDRDAIAALDDDAFDKATEGANWKKLWQEV